MPQQYSSIVAWQYSASVVVVTVAVKNKYLCTIICNAFFSWKVGAFRITQKTHSDNAQASLSLLSFANLAWEVSTQPHLTNE